MRAGTAAAYALLAATVLTACAGDPCEPAPPASPGTAAAHVRMVRSDDVLPGTVDVVRWERAVHPQVPAEGEKIHVDYRFASSDMALTPATASVQACAVDGERVVQACTEVAWRPQAGETSLDADEWLTVGDAAAVTDVLLLPAQMAGGVHPCDDPKDGGGYVPPRVLAPGARV